MCTNQKDSLQAGHPQTKTWVSEVYCYKAADIVWRQCLFLTVIGYNIRIFLSERELVSGCFISIFRNYLIFAYDFQKHKQEVTQFKLN